MFELLVCNNDMGTVLKSFKTEKKKKHKNKLQEIERNWKILTTKMKTL